MEDPSRICRRGPLGPLFVSPVSSFFMKAGHVLLVAAAGLFLYAFTLNAAAPGTQSSAATHAAAVPPNTTAADYLGSKACASCHQDAFDQWQRSLHIRMTKPIAEATVVGDFSSAARLNDHGRAFEFGTTDGRPFMRITFGTAKPETFRVDYTLGFKRYQGYLSTLPDGRI